MAAAAQTKYKRAYDPYNLCIMEIENASMLGTAIQQWLVKEYKQKWGRQQNFLCGKGYVRTQTDALRMGSLVNALDDRSNPTSVYLLATIDSLKKRFDELTRADTARCERCNSSITNDWKSAVCSGYRRWSSV